MNVSLNQIAYDVIELYRANYKDTDSVDIRQVYYWVNTARALMIKQRLDKNVFNIFREELQLIQNITMAQVDNSTTIIVSSSALPLTINRKGYPGTVTKVWCPGAPLPVDSTADAFSSSPVQMVAPERFERVGNRKFNSGFYYATIGHDNKLYIKTHTISGNTVSAIEGVFQDPIEVMNFNSVSAPYDADYPINSELIKDLVSMIVSERFQLILRQQEDKQTSDGRDSIAQ